MKEIIFRTIGEAKLYVIRHSDKILLGLGIASLGGSVVTTAKASMQLNDKIAECNERIQKIKAQMANESDVANGVVDLSLKKKELTKEYFKAAGTIGKLYLVPSVLFVAGVGMVCGSHHIVQQRLASTTALLTLTKNKFDDYRNRVKDILGEEKEQMIYNGQKEETVEVTDKDGKKTKQKVLVRDKNAALDYNQILWGASTVSPCYFKDIQDAPIAILQQVTETLSYRLRTRGYIKGTDIINELGIDISKLPPEQVLAWQNLGLVYDPADTEINDFIDLGFRDPSTGNLTRDAKEFELGMKDEIVLTINFCGDIVNGERKLTDYINGKRGHWL